MSTIRAISISLTADISEFQVGMLKSSSILKMFKRTAELDMASLSGKMIDWSVMFGAAAGGAAVVGLTALVAHTVDAITQQTRLADRLELSTQMLSGFEVAAAAVGMESEQTTTALDHFNRTFGEALAGSEKAIEVFEKAGISLEELASEGADERLNTIANKFHAMASGSEKAHLSMQLFGRGAAQMVSVLEQGEEGLRNNIEKADQLGLALNRIDSAQVVQVTKDFTELKEIFMGIATQLTVQLAPFIHAITEEFIKAGEAGGGIGPIVTNAFELVLKSIVSGVEYLKLFETGWYGLKAIVITAVQGMVQVIGLIPHALQGILNLFDTIQDKISKAVVATAKLNEEDAKRSGDKDGASFYHQQGRLAQQDLDKKKEHFTELSKLFDDLNSKMQKDSEDAAFAAQQAFKEFGSGSNTIAVTQLFNKIRQESKDAAKVIADNLDLKKLNSIKENKKLFDDQDSDFDLEDKGFHKLLELADKLRDKLKTPAEEFRAKMEEALMLMDKHLISPEIVNRQLKASEDEFARKDNELHKQGKFKQFDANSTSVEAMRSLEGNKKQEITSKQLEVTNKILEELNKKFDIKEVAYAG